MGGVRCKRGKGVTYECSSFGLDEGSAIVGWIEDSSSRWTATEKRFQKAGSRTAAMTRLLVAVY